VTLAVTVTVSGCLGFPGLPDACGAGVIVFVAGS
jgi:hypothetical protein